MSTKSRWEDSRLVFFDSAQPAELVSPVSPVYIYDDFTAPITADATDAAVYNSAVPWNFSIVNAATLVDAADADAVGVATMTTGNADDDDCDLSTGLVFYATMAPSIEVRLANEDVDKLAHFIGFSDAITEAADTIAIMSGAVLADNVASAATNAAGWLWDPDLTTDYLACVSVNADADGANYTTTTALTDGAWAIYRVDIDAAGNAYFYLNGSLIYTEALAVATTAPLCGTVQIINHPGNTDSVNIDYIRIWGNRQE